MKNTKRLFYTCCLLACCFFSSCNKDSEWIKWVLIPDSPPTLMLHPMQVLFTPGANKLIVLNLNTANTSTLVHISIDNGRVDSFSLGELASFSDIGYHNGRYELYLGTEKGMIRIYDASTLSLIEEFSFGKPVKSIDYFDKILYVSSDDGNTSNYTLVERDTRKTILSRRFPIIDNYSVRAIALKETDTSRVTLACATLNVTPGRFVYIHNLNPPQFEDYHASDWSNSASIDGRKMLVMQRGKTLTHEYGNIFNNYAQHEYKLAGSSIEYTDYAYDQVTDEIFAFAPADKQIRVFDKQFLVRKSYSTQYYPQHLLLNGDEIVCLSIAGPQNAWTKYSYSEYAVERIRR